MRKKKRQDNNNVSPSKREWSRLRRMPRLMVYGFGIVTLLWYFWCVIGLIIGVLYYIFFNDNFCAMWFDGLINWAVKY